MSLLKIEDATFENIEGKLVAQTIEMINYKVKEGEEKPSITLIPLVSDDFDEFIKLVNKKEDDDAKKKEVEQKVVEILISHIQAPVFTKEYFKIIKPRVLNSIIKSLLFVSGVGDAEVEITEKTDK